MADQRLPRLTLLRVLTIAGFWTLVAFAFAGQFYLSNSLLGRSVAWQAALSYALADWYVWAVLSVPIVWFARRQPPEGAHAVRTGALHLGAALVCSFLYVLLRSLVGVAHARLLGEPTAFADLFRPLFVQTFPFNLIVYGVIVAVSHAADYYRKYHARTVHALELEKHLTEARLQSLLRQLKPHFLFNTLNGIATLMHRDLASADRMLVRLSELLRLTMHQSGEPLAPVRGEIAFIRTYLDIESIRFADRITVEIDIDPALLDTLIPSLVLQPLVENAINHGIEPLTRPGRLRIEGRMEDEHRVLRVRDNGPGLPPGGFNHQGIGLVNTRARLAELYGSAARLELANHADGGLEVTLRFPR